MAVVNAPQYGDFGGQKLGIQLSSIYNPVKHLESNSFASIAGPNMTWLGIMNYIDMYEQNYQPLMSMSEMTKNTIYIDGNQTSFLYGQPYKLGCPFIMGILCENSKLGYQNSTFHAIISENLYSYGDILMTHRRHGKGLMVVSEKEGGDDAKIVQEGGGYRYLLKMASGEEKDYIDHSEVAVGIEIERVDFAGGDEFKSESTSYTGNLLSSGSNRYGMDMYRFNVGTSDLSISYLITADASLKKLKMDNVLPQLNGLPVQASEDIINFFAEQHYAGMSGSTVKLKGVAMWLPRFMVNLGKELKDLQEMKNMYSTGWSKSNGRETLYGGLGLYPQIKRKGNHFYYSSFIQAFDLIKQMLSALYSGKYSIPIEKRFIEIDLGDGIYEQIYPMFKAYFETDNKIIFTGDHPAYKDVLTRDANGKLVYKPAEFASVFYPSFGWIKINRNSRLSNLDNNRKNQDFIDRHPESAFMIFIKDITDETFTGADLKGVTKPANAGNLLYIKKDGVPDSMEYTIGSGYISPALLSAVGANSGNPGSRDNSFNGLKLTLRTHGEVFLQDASRMVIAEYDPTGDREWRDRTYAKAPLF